MELTRENLQKTSEVDFGAMSWGAMYLPVSETAKSDFVATGEINMYNSNAWLMVVPNYTCLMDNPKATGVDDEFIETQGFAIQSYNRVEGFASGYETFPTYEELYSYLNEQLANDDITLEGNNDWVAAECAW